MKDVKVVIDGQELKMDTQLDQTKYRTQVDAARRVQQNALREAGHNRASRRSKLHKSRGPSNRWTPRKQRRLAIQGSNIHFMYLEGIEKSKAA